MATSAEQTFIRTVATAEGVRQAAKAAAFATYGFVAANLATYVAALETADNAYLTSVNSALNTLAAYGITAPNQGPAAQNPVCVGGQLGTFGPIAGNIATLGSVA